MQYGMRGRQAARTSAVHTPTLAPCMLGTEQRCAACSLPAALDAAWSGQMCLHSLLAEAAGHSLVEHHVGGRMLRADAVALQGPRGARGTHVGTVRGALGVACGRKQPGAEQGGSKASNGTMARGAGGGRSVPHAARASPRAALTM